MLVLSRKLQEQIRIGENITVTVLRVKGNAVRIGIDAPRNVRVVRGELPPKSIETTTGQVQDRPVEGDDQDCGDEGRHEEQTEIGRMGRGPVFAALLQMSTNAV
jgi:carbon storage regulator CsrA